MAHDLAAAIDEAREQAFVGRAAELASFDEALSVGSPRRVLFVHGPGGIGKTTLLHQFRMRARACGHAAVAIDGRDVDCTTEALRAALDQAVAAARREDAPGWVLLLDGYERFGQLDPWVRDDFLPSLDAGAVVVLLGRDPPSPPWRTDPAWRALAAVHCLDALTQVESIDLLAHAGVPTELRPHLALLGRGHPMTLALLADATTASGAVPDDLADAPDLVAALVAQVVGDAPSEAHAMGLALCAHSWLTTEDLLRHAVGDRAPEVWAWLEAQPYVTRGADGLYPHDLVREVLDADLRRRSPDTYRQINRIVHEQAMAALRRRDGVDQHLWAQQKLHLHRRSPVAFASWTLRERGAGAVVPGRTADHPAVLDMIEKFEGKESAALAERWLDEQPENLAVVRSPTRLAGFAFQVMYPADPSLCDADPVVRTVLAEAARRSPARPGEQISIARFLSGADDHQRDPHGVMAGAVGSTVTWCSRPLAWAFVATLDPAFWGPAFKYMAFTVEFPVRCGELEYMVYGLDWRRCSIESWLELMGERELSGATGPPPPELLRPPPLDRTSFAEAVRAALRDLHRPDRLRVSPLMGSALAVGFEGADADRLRANLVRAIEQVGREPRAETLGRVLDRTFVRCAPTQEAAAEVLDVPFSTYRRHLAKAVERLTDLLWAVEIGELRLSTD